MVPIANVVSIAIKQSYSNTIVQQHLYVLNEVRVDKVARLLEREVDLVVRLCVIQIDAQSVLCGSHVQEVNKVCWRRGIVKWMADIVLRNISECFTVRASSLPLRDLHRNNTLPQRCHGTCSLLRYRLRSR